MISTYKHKNLTWIDLESPSSDEVKSLMRKYSIHPLVAEELLKPTLRPKVDIYKNFIYLILHFPIFEHERKTSISYEIDFIIGKNFLITAHYKSITPLYEITKIFEAGSMLGQGHFIKNTGVLVFFIIKQLYEFALRQIDHIQIKIDKIEEDIFKGRERDIVEVISRVRRDLLDFQKCVHMHESILDSLEAAGKDFLGSDFSHYAHSIIEELGRVKNHLIISKETIESLQNTNDSLLTDRVNDIMKTLSILAFLTFPLMLFAAIFSMETKFTPLIGLKGDFWIIVGLILVATSGMILIFKRKRWL
jgi:magnesium transporter